MPIDATTCPCCHLEWPHEHYNICPECRWEDDGISDLVGPNGLTLADYQAAILVGLCPLGQERHFHQICNRILNHH